MAVAERGITHGLRYQARALAQVPAARDNSAWLAGTTALREENEVEVLEFDAESDTLRRSASYRHPPEIWHIASCPEDPLRLITVFNDGGRYGATLWRADLHKQQLEAQASLCSPPALGEAGGAGGGGQRIHAALWRQGGIAATVEDLRLRCWQIGEAEAQEIGSLEGEAGATFAGGAWDPTDSSRLASIASKSVQLWDVRSMKRTGGVAAASPQQLRDCHFACNTPHVLSTVGDDQQLRVWDLRRADSGPLLTLGGHSRWVWRVRHNPVHDSLLLTSAADCAVGLHYLPGIRAAAQHKRPVAPPPPGKPPPDGRVHSIGDHEEAVYGVEWSTVDPWVFASLSYDGRVVINRVPSSLKYKILI